MWRVTGGDSDWFFGFGAYLLRVGDALSQLGNVIIGGKNPNESISGRAWRLRSRTGWGIARKAIDLLFFFDKNHCHMSYVADLQRARILIAESAARRFDIL